MSVVYFENSTSVATISWSGHGLWTVDVSVRRSVLNTELLSGNVQSTL